MRGARYLKGAQTIGVRLPGEELPEEDDIVLGIELDDFGVKVGAQESSYTEIKQITVKNICQRMDRVVITHQVALRLRGTGGNYNLWLQSAQRIDALRLPNRLRGLRPDVVAQGVIIDVTTVSHIQILIADRTP